VILAFAALCSGLNTAKCLILVYIYAIVPEREASVGVTGIRMLHCNADVQGVLEAIIAVSG